MRLEIMGLPKSLNGIIFFRKEIPDTISTSVFNP